MSHLYAVPLALKESNEFVAKHHRHHDPVYRDKFRVGCIEGGGTSRGCKCRQTSKQSLG